MSVIRSFGIQSIAGASSQPLFGTTLAADGVLTPDQFSGNTKPGSNQSLSYFQVVNSIGFRVGDIVALAAKGDFAYPYTSIDGGTIKHIESGSPYDIVTVQGLVRSHVSGEYFVLNEPVANLFVERETSIGTLYFGNGSDVSPTAASVFGTLQASASQPFKRSSGAQFSPYNTIELWTYGSAGDSFIASWDAF